MSDEFDFHGSDEEEDEQRGRMGTYEAGEEERDWLEEAEDAVDAKMSQDVG